MASFKGVSATQDKKFIDKEKKLLRTTVFPNIYKSPVNIKKVNIQVFRQWIYEKITQLLNMEDDIVTEYAFSLLEEESVDPRDMQIKLTGFLENKTESFMVELWTLLLDAQNSIGGIPKEFLEKKKLEIMQKKMEDERLAREMEKRREEHAPREYRDAPKDYRDRREYRNSRDRREYFPRDRRDSRERSDPRDAPRDGHRDSRDGHRDHIQEYKTKRYPRDYSPPPHSSRDRPVNDKEEEM